MHSAETVFVEIITSKMSSIFLLQLNITKRQQDFFSTWGPETKEQIKLAKY